MLTASESLQFLHYNQGPSNIFIVFYQEQSLEYNLISYFACKV